MSSRFSGSGRHLVEKDFGIGSDPITRCAAQVLTDPHLSIDRSPGRWVTVPSSRPHLDLDLATPTSGGGATCVAPCDYVVIRLKSRRRRETRAAHTARGLRRSLLRTCSASTRTEATSRRWHFVRAPGRLHRSPSPCDSSLQRTTQQGGESSDDLKNVRSADSGWDHYLVPPAPQVSCDQLIEIKPGRLTTSIRPCRDPGTSPTTYVRSRFRPLRRRLQRQRAPTTEGTGATCSEYST